MEQSHTSHSKLEAMPPTMSGETVGSMPSAISHSSTLQHQNDLHSVNLSQKGASIHTLLEWSAVSLAFFTAILAFAHFSINPDVTTPILGVTLFCAGLMDAFHILAADQLIQSAVKGHQFTHFTWLLCRFGNALLPMLGAILFLIGKPRRVHGNLTFVLAISTIFGAAVLGSLFATAASPILPNTMLPFAAIKQPWDLIPLGLFAIAGLVIYPRFYRQHPNLFSHALQISTIPSIATQLYMAFGSSVHFDYYFNSAHVLKSVAYSVPLVGLIFDYTITNQKVRAINEKLFVEIEERKQSENRERHKSQELEQTLYALQKAQGQLVQSEKMSSLGLLVTGVAHEINNPVGFLKGNIQPALQYTQDLFHLLDLYQEKYPNPDLAIREEIEAIDLEFVREDLPKLIGSMQEGVDRIKDISLSLRTFSRADSDKPVAFDLHEGLESTLLILKHRLKQENQRPAIEIIKNYGHLPQVECFAGQLNQVFMNILSNAIEAFDEKSEKCTSEDRLASNQISISTALSDDQSNVLISIKDNALGMPEEIRARIFDHLFTTKAVGKGTGLGLAISHQIVEGTHGGKLNCYSVPGQGTEFMIQIPVRQLAKL